MPDFIKRRDFLRTASLAGASLAIAKSGATDDFFPEGNRVQIRNDFFTISFDKKKGAIDVFRKDGSIVLAGGTFNANLVKEGRRSSLDMGRLCFTQGLRWL